MNGNQNQERYNVVVNWNLHVFEVRPTPKGQMLSASLSGRKKQDGSYAKGMNVSVFVGQNTRCEFAQGMNLANMDISVDGTFSKDDYTGKDNVIRPQFTIFAERVSIRQRQNRQNNQGYQNQPQGGYNQGYNNQPQQGGYNQGYNNQPPQQNQGYPQNNQSYQNQPQGGYQNQPQQGGYNQGYNNQPPQPPQQNQGYPQNNQGYQNQPQGGYPQNNQPQGGQPQQNFDYSEFQQFNVDENGVPF